MSTIIFLKDLKKGDIFKRKPEANTEYVRGHYNRKDQFGPAGYCCDDAWDIGRSIFLKGKTKVYI